MTLTRLERVEMVRRVLTDFYLKFGRDPSTQEDFDLVKEKFRELGLAPNPELDTVPDEDWKEA
ncbi:MAG: hypothetical protein ACYSWO_29220 [Planctomycetota bacterium]|jgi:hypothetical protein